MGVTTSGGASIVVLSGGLFVVTITGVGIRNFIPFGRPTQAPRADCITRPGFRERVYLACAWPKRFKAVRCPRAEREPTFPTLSGPVIVAVAPPQVPPMVAVGRERNRGAGGLGPSWSWRLKKDRRPQSFRKVRGESWYAGANSRSQGL